MPNVLINAASIGDRFQECFTASPGGREELELALQAGLYIGITGWVCDERPERGGDALAALLSLIPGDKLLIETDCPYLTPRSIGCAPCSSQWHKTVIRGCRSSLVAHYVYLSMCRPNKLRPSRNEPALLPFVLERVAAARGQTAAEVAALTLENTKRLFAL